MSNAQKTAPERIWIAHINPDPNGMFALIGKADDSDSTEYVRADLQRDRAVEFAEWILEHTETSYGEVLTYINGQRLSDMGSAYQIFLTERGYK